MTLTSDQINTTAELLFKAEQTATQTALISQQFPDMTMEDAYAIQAALVQHKLSSGRSIIGWKIGLTSKAMQDALKIDIPDSGIIFDDMLFKSGATIPANRFIQTRIEAEIAFVFKKGLSAGSVTRQDVLAATDYITPALEILDTRIVRKDESTGKVRNIMDTISDNAANAGIVVGDQQFDPSSIDMRWIGAIVQRNGEVEETGLGAGVLNDPVVGIQWLVERLGQYNQSITAGDILLSGSFIRPVEARSGDQFFADFGGFGTIECRFA